MSAWEIVRMSIVFGLIIFVIITMYREKLHAGSVFIIVMATLVGFGILTPQESMQGFANQNLIVIILLLIISSILKRSGILDYFFSKTFHSKLSYRWFLFKMTTFVSGFSAFMNNTPIVALLLPYAHEWGRKNNISPSKLLIPLSFASIFGGMATLIGTSTNLVVNSLWMDKGMETFSIFDFTYVGIPVIIIGITYLLLFGNKLLPANKDLLKSFDENSRKYLIEARIRRNSALVGKSVEEANLDILKGIYIVEIIRNKEIITPVSNEEILRKGDILLFTGEIDQISDLVRRTSGLRLVDNKFFKEQEKINIIEAVIPYNSPLIRKSIHIEEFRAKYNAAILAVHRDRMDITAKDGSLFLKSGDVLLLVAGHDFWEISAKSGEFHVITHVKEIQNLDLKKMIVLLGGLLTVIVLSTLDVVPLFVSLVVFIAVLILVKIAYFSELKAMFNVDIVLIIGSAFALGKAMELTGAADMLSRFLLTAFLPLGTVGVLFGVYILSNLLTGFITNIAAATIVFPIAFAAATSLGVNPAPFVLATAYGSAASFITPIGYQTNLMVYGPGGYKLKDFMRIGIPLSVIMMFTVCFILSWRYNLFVS